MIFAFFSVTIIDSIIIEVLDRIERKERKLFAKVQRKLLELYTQAANHAAKMDEQAEAATSPDKMEQMMDDSLLVLDEEEADDADGADGAGGADRVYRNELHRLLSWLYRMSNHYANTRDAIIWVILVFIGVGFYMGTQKCTPARQHASTPARQHNSPAQQPSSCLTSRRGRLPPCSSLSLLASVRTRSVCSQDGTVLLLSLHGSDADN